LVQALGLGTSGQTLRLWDRHWDFGTDTKTSRQILGLLDRHWDFRTDTGTSGQALEL